LGDDPRLAAASSYFLANRPDAQPRRKAEKLGRNFNRVDTIRRRKPENKAERTAPFAFARPAIRYGSCRSAPTLVLRTAGDRWCEAGEALYLEARIAGARRVELPGNDHVIWGSHRDRLLEEIARFVTELPEQPVQVFHSTSARPA
jgi:pimeloyl-ACP methyl ester carboxylesterase